MVKPVDVLVRLGTLIMLLYQDRSYPNEAADQLFFN